jgi:hypothetical protein
MENSLEISKKYFGEFYFFLIKFYSKRPVFGFLGEFFEKEIYTLFNETF